MPDSEEKQRHYLAVHLRAQKLQSFVDVLGAPLIGVYVEREDVVIKLRGGFERPQSDVGATVPLHATLGVHSVVS